MSQARDALAGVRVVDCSVGRAGPLAAMFFADFGADVVRVEDSDADRGPGSVVWNRGKRRVASDDASIESLIRSADVVVASESALVGRARGLSNGCIVLHVPPHLDPQVWAGGAESDALITAWMGIPLRQISFDGGPIDSIYPVVTTIQGTWAAACAVAALIERERSGDGQVVTVAGDHGAMIAAGGALTFRYGDLDAVTDRRRGGPGGTIPFYRTYECGDGEWLFFAALTPRFTQIGFEVLGITELFDDPRLEGRGRAAMITPEHAAWVTDVVAERFLAAHRDEWIERFRAIGCPVGAVLDRDEWLDHPQVAAIDMRRELDGVVMPGVPLRLDRTPGRVHDTADEPPRWEPREPSSTRAGQPAAGPLAGVRVLDLGAIIAGPFAASLLGDLGADVIKVEPLTGDSFRGPGFAAYNKGQRGVALDLRRNEGRTAFLDLVRSADIVIDNYRPGVLGRLGIEWNALHEVNPNVISASITGFGDGGPYGGDAGFDPVLQAMSGMMRAQGGDSDPVFFTVPVNDVAGSATLALGAVLALFHRERTGESQKVTTSLAAMSVMLQTEALVRYEGRPPAPRGSRDHVGPSPLQRFYRAADGWFRLEAPDTDAITALTGSDIAAWAASRNRDDALRELFDAGIPAVAARTLAEIASDPDVQTNNVLHTDPRPDRDGCTAGRHALFSRTMRTDTLISPRLGEHTREVFAEIGYTQEQIDALIGSGAATAD